jgi:hypothetical protein
MSDLNLLWHNKKLNIGSQYFSESKQKLKKFENKILFFHVILCLIKN